MYKHLMVLLMLCIGGKAIAVTDSNAQSTVNLSEQHRLLYWFTIGLGGTSTPEVQGMAGTMMVRGVFAWDNSTISANVEGSSSSSPLSIDLFGTEKSVAMYSLLFGRQLWYPLNKGAWILRGAIGPAYIEQTTTRHFFFAPMEESKRTELGLALELEGLIEPQILGAGLSTQLYVTRHSFMGSVTVNISFGKFE